MLFPYPTAEMGSGKRRFYRRLERGKRLLPSTERNGKSPVVSGGKLKSKVARRQKGIGSVGCAA